MPDAPPLVYVHRDPFARTSTVRVRKPGGECRWCGRPARFRYGSSPDDSARVHLDIDSKGGPVTFCSRDCRRAYYAE